MSRDDREPGARQWQSELHRDHPLVGRLWSAAEGDWITREALEADLASARVVLLGERHDNLDHHQLQAALLEALVQAGQRPAVALEMIDTDRQGELDQLDEAATADQVAQAVGWADRWGDFEPYRPIIEVALEANLPLVAANFPIEQTRALVRQGPAALEPEVVTRLGLDHPLPEPSQASLIAELRQAHCGHPLPQPMLEGMALAQRARDASMAAQLAEAAASGSALLIAGAGHVRSDRGVPAELERLGLERRQIRAVTFAEVDPDLTAPANYAERFGADQLPYDVVWFTPAARRADPCEAFRRMRRHPPDEGSAQP